MTLEDTLLRDSLEWLHGETGIPLKVLEERAGIVVGPWQVADLVTDAEARRQFLRRVPHRVRAYTRNGHPVKAHTRRGQGPITTDTETFHGAFWGRRSGRLTGFRDVEGRLRPVTYRLPKDVRNGLYAYMERRSAQLWQQHIPHLSFSETL